MRKKLLILIGLVCLLALQYRLWFGSGGVVDTNKLRSQLQTLRVANQRILSANIKLASDVVRWKRGNAGAIEAYARRNLGMIKRHELFYQLTDAGA